MFVGMRSGIRAFSGLISSTMFDIKFIGRNVHVEKMKTKQKFDTKISRQHESFPIITSTPPFYHVQCQRIAIYFHPKRD